MDDKKQGNGNESDRLPDSSGRFSFPFLPGQNLFLSVLRLKQSGREHQSGNETENSVGMDAYFRFCFLPGGRLVTVLVGHRPSARLTSRQGKEREKNIGSARIYFLFSFLFLM